MARELQIRKLPPRNVQQLVEILDHGDSWKQLMAVIPKNTASQANESKYTFEHFKMIEHAGASWKRSCSEILLEEWGTSGRKQPTVALLLELLVKAELFRAAEYVAIELLKEAPPKRPTTGVAAYVDISKEIIPNGSMFLEEQICIPTKLENSESELYVNISQHFDVTEEESNLRKYNFDHLAQKIVIPGRYDEGTDIVVVGSNAHGVSGALDVSMNGIGDISQSNCSIPVETSVKDVPDVTEGSLQLNTLLPHFPYSELECCTANFCEQLTTSNQQISEARKLGTGAFGSVYLGVYPSQNYVAVKKLKRDVTNIEKQFKNEVEALSRYQHRHLLPLLGYSCDGPAYCLVYQYMCNGSLQERLACQGSTPVLPWKTRLHIALGTSEGILHLHSAYEKPLIHRDIKSANILLDKNFVPKLGDFGLVRLGASGQQSHSIAFTSTVFGTSAYMAPEAFRGDISVKLDTFSFGVVMLELLTSLPPYNEQREGCDLVTHVQEICESSIEPLLDTKAGNWGKSAAVQPAEIFYSVALDCLKEKRHRPNMDCVVKSIQDILTCCV